MENYSFPLKITLRYYKWFSGVYSKTDLISISSDHVQVRETFFLSEYVDPLATTIHFRGEEEREYPYELHCKIDGIPFLALITQEERDSLFSHIAEGEPV